MWLFCSLPLQDPSFGVEFISRGLRGRALTPVSAPLYFFFPPLATERKLPIAACRHAYEAGRDWRTADGGWDGEGVGGPDEKGLGNWLGSMLTLGADSTVTLHSQFLQSQAIMSRAPLWSTTASRLHFSFGWRIRGPSMYLCSDVCCTFSVPLAAP